MPVPILMNPLATSAFPDTKPQQRVEKVPETPDESGGFRPFGDDGLTFGDLLDIVNPLQHIPVVSSIYRALTGDEIAPVPRIAGGALIGGPIGAAVAFVNTIIEQASGRDMGEHVIAMMTGDDAHPQAVEPTAIAQASPALTPPAVSVRGVNSLPVVEAAEADIPSSILPQVNAAPIPRRGGWIVNAAYANVDAYAAVANSRGNTASDIDTFA